MIISILSSLKAQADELREIKRIFNRIDINKDGRLTFDELMQSMKDVKLYELFSDENLEAQDDDNESMVRRIMMMCDVDGDNHISYHEFVQAAIDHSALLNKPNIDQIFDMLDINGDGQIDQQELRESFKISSNDDDEIIK